MADEQPIDIDSISREQIAEIAEAELSDPSNGIGNTTSDPSNGSVQEPDNSEIAPEADESVTDEDPKPTEEDKDKTKKKIEKIIARRKTSVPKIITDESTDQSPEKPNLDEDLEEPKKEDLESIIDKKVDNAINNRDQRTEAEKLDIQELDSLIDQYPGLKEYRQDLLEAGKDNNMSYLQIARAMLEPSEYTKVFLDKQFTNKTTAKTMLPVGQTQPGVRSDFNPATATDDELKKEIINQGLL